MFDGEFFNLTTTNRTQRFALYKRMNDCCMRLNSQSSDCFLRNVCGLIGDFKLPYYFQPNLIITRNLSLTTSNDEFRKDWFE